jgi:hypothetical protein
VDVTSRRYLEGALEWWLELEALVDHSLPALVEAHQQLYIYRVYIEYIYREIGWGEEIEAEGA